MNTFSRALQNLKQAQPEIVLYGLFCLPVCIADLWLTFVGPHALKAQTVPFTGWSASMPYLFGLFWVFYLLLGRDRRFFHRWGIVAPLMVSIVFALIQYAAPHTEDFGNPYLRVSPWQPVWTVVIPAFWVALLLLTPMIRSLVAKRRAAFV